MKQLPVVTTIYIWTATFDCGHHRVLATAKRIRRGLYAECSECKSYQRIVDYHADPDNPEPRRKGGR